MLIFGNNIDCTWAMRFLKSKRGKGQRAKKKVVAKHHDNSAYNNNMLVTACTVYTVQLFEEEVSGPVGRVRLVELRREAVRDCRVRRGRCHGNGQSHGGGGGRGGREELQLRRFRRHFGRYLQ